MDFKERTKEELEKRVEKLERFINKHGIGARYLNKAERVQRNLNLFIFLGAFTGLATLIGWLIFRSREEEE